MDEDRPLTWNGEVIGWWELADDGGFIGHINNGFFAEMFNPEVSISLRRNDEGDE